MLVEVTQAVTSNFKSISQLTPIKNKALRLSEDFYFNNNYSNIDKI
jgi:hypothetical protein